MTANLDSKEYYLLRSEDVEYINLIQKNIASDLNNFKAILQELSFETDRYIIFQKENFNFILILQEFLSKTVCPLPLLDKIWQRRIKAEVKNNKEDERKVSEENINLLFNLLNSKWTIKILEENKAMKEFFNPSLTQKKRANRKIA
ncbi:hypothetical protein ABMA71_16575 [Halobacteriovorax sp. ZH3_bin.1]|uniref:hypothetical protein n=1 Tax=Halobacteriovorax sp. ZH3_bin.1 TaxID=3157725 RepID=UPI003723FB0B